MDRRQTAPPSGQVQHSVAVGELAASDKDYDTSSTAWAAFDAGMTEQLADLERRLHHYFTPAATRKSLGRS